MRLRIFLVCTSVRISNNSSSVPKPPGKSTTALSEIDEPKLPHEEVVKAEVQLPADVRVIELLIGDRDREPDVDLASEAPRFAASMMPGPPPVQTTKRRSS